VVDGFRETFEELGLPLKVKVESTLAGAVAGALAAGERDAGPGKVSVSRYPRVSIDQRHGMHSAAGRRRCW